MSRTNIFIKAYEEIIKPGLIKFEMESVNMGVCYEIKQYPFRIYAKEGFRLMEAQCGCRNNIFRPSLLCAHNIAGLVQEFIRVNKLILVDPNDPLLKIKTAFDLEKGEADEKGQ
jgi:hypothetical protein